MLSENVRNWIDENPLTNENFKEKIKEHIAVYYSRMENFKYSSFLSIINNFVGDAQEILSHNLNYLKYFKHSNLYSLYVSHYDLLSYEFCLSRAFKTFQSYKTDGTLTKAEIKELIFYHGFEDIFKTIKSSFNFSQSILNAMMQLGGNKDSQQPELGSSPFNDLFFTPPKS